MAGRPRRVLSPGRRLPSTLLALFPRQGAGTRRRRVVRSRAPGAPLRGPLGLHDALLGEGGARCSPLLWASRRGRPVRPGVRRVLARDPWPAGRFPLQLRCAGRRVRQLPKPRWGSSLFLETQGSVPMPAPQGHRCCGAGVPDKSPSAPRWER